MVGKLNPTDPDANATITLAFSDGNGSEYNHLFSLDANGTLRTNATFDYETNATTMRIRAKATDEHNASLVTADMQAKVDAAAASITSGSMKVHNYTDDETCSAVSF